MTALKKTEQRQTVDDGEIERFTRIAEEWWDEKGKFRPLHLINPVRLQYIRDKICTHYRRAPETRESLKELSVLDIGCGGGLLCEPLTRLGADVTGIDAGDKNIKVAALHAEKMGLAVNYQCTTAEAMQGQYDVVLALEIIEHVADVPAFLRAVTALVKPGGILFMSTLNRTAKSYAMAIVGAEYILRWLPRGTHSWQKFLKPSELCAGLRQEGMQIEHMTGMVFNPFGGGWRLKDSDLDVNYLLTATKV
jgi:2-polyprenyl-6-hydroxyphenyl methylase/3-demethylubiquinone-9 3-methyltransferase